MLSRSSFLRESSSACGARGGCARYNGAAAAAPSTPARWRSHFRWPRARTTGGAASAAAGASSAAAAGRVGAILYYFQHPPLKTYSTEPMESPFTRPSLSRRGFRRGRLSHRPRGPRVSHGGDRPRWDTRGTECTAPGSKSRAVLRPRRLRRRRKIAPRLQPIDRHRSKIIAYSSRSSRSQIRSEIQSERSQ